MFRYGTEDMHPFDIVNNIFDVGLEMLFVPLLINKVQELHEQVKCVSISHADCGCSGANWLRISSRTCYDSELDVSCLPEKAQKDPGQSQLLASFASPIQGSFVTHRKVAKATSLKHCKCMFQSTAALISGREAAIQAT